MDHACLASLDLDRLLTVSVDDPAAKRQLPFGSAAVVVILVVVVVELPQVPGMISKDIYL